MYKIILLLTIFSIFLSNCVKDEKIDNFPVEKPKIVVNCIIKNNKPMEFYISKSLSSIDNSPLKKVSNAKVEIFENKILVETLLTESINPKGTVDAYFMSKLKPEFGKYYKIIVSAPNLNSVIAETSLPNELLGVTAHFEKVDTMISQLGYNRQDSLKSIIFFKSGSILINIPDIPLTKNYYRVNLYYEDKYWDKVKWVYEYKRMVIRSDKDYYDNYPNGLFLNDQLFDGKNIAVNLNLSNSSLTHSDNIIKLKVVISSQSEAKQKYDISLGQYYQNQSNPFIEPTLVYSNILNGYGIFASESELEIGLKY
jgi:hypothetical protein